MQYLDGETLARRLERGALPLDRTLQIAIHMADALDKAHRAGITHRDLKPANIMLTKAGATLLDFGLAKLRGPAAPISMSGMTRLATERRRARFVPVRSIRAERIEFIVASRIQESLEAQQFVQFYDEAAILKGWSAGHRVGIVRVGVHHEQLAPRLILPPEAKVRCH